MCALSHSSSVQRARHAAACTSLTAKTHSSFVRRARHEAALYFSYGISTLSSAMRCACYEAA